jgi:hypothetical protein
MGYEHNVPKHEIRKLKFEVFAQSSVFLGKWYVEGHCEDCGNFDLLSYRDGLYLCELCSECQKVRRVGAETS